MQLLKWQKENKINNRELSKKVRAKKVKCHETMISHYHAGRKNFSPIVAAAIENITDSDVTLREILLRTK